MPSIVGLGAFRIGAFIALTSGLLLLVLDRGTAEFTLMIGMFLLSICFLSVIAILVRVLPRR